MAVAAGFEAGIDDVGRDLIGWTSTGLFVEVDDELILAEVAGVGPSRNLGENGQAGLFKEGAIAGYSSRAPAAARRGDSGGDERDLDYEDGPDAEFAGDIDGPAHCADQPLDDGEADAQPAEGPPGPLLSLVELRKNLLEHFGRNARPLVADGDAIAISEHLACYRDPSLLAEPDCVVDQLGDDTSERFAIRRDRDRLEADC